MEEQIKRTQLLCHFSCGFYKKLCNHSVNLNHQFMLHIKKFFGSTSNS